MPKHILLQSHVINTNTKIEYRYKYKKHKYKYKYKYDYKRAGRNIINLRGAVAVVKR